MAGMLDLHGALLVRNARMPLPLSLPIECPCSRTTSNVHILCTHTTLQAKIFKDLAVADRKSLCCTARELRMCEGKDQAHHQ